MTEEARIHESLDCAATGVFSVATTTLLGCVGYTIYVPVMNATEVRFLLTLLFFLLVNVVGVELSIRQVRRAIRAAKPPRDLPIPTSAQ